MVTVIWLPLLLVPTLFGIILINFAIVQFAPGGPVEQMLAELREAHAAGAADAFRRAAHSRKSNSNTFGASRLAG